jgi:hypothetical protein
MRWPAVLSLLFACTPAVTTTTAIPPADAGADGFLEIHCDLAGQSCRAEGNRCDYRCGAGGVVTLGCVAEAAVVADVGERCRPENQDAGAGDPPPCRKGASCLVDHRTPAPICFKYCQSDADCPVGKCEMVMIIVACPPAGARFSAGLCR